MTKPTPHFTSLLRQEIALDPIPLMNKREASPIQYDCRVLQPVVPANTHFENDPLDGGHSPGT